MILEIFYVYMCKKCNNNIAVRIPIIDPINNSAYKQINDFKKNYNKRCLYCQNTKGFAEIYTGEKEKALTYVDKTTGIDTLYKYQSKQNQYI